MQTIDHQSNLAMTRAAAETRVSNKNTYDMQRRYGESNKDSVDRTICLSLETDPKIMIEEAHHFIVFRSRNMKSSIEKRFMKVLKQRRSELKNGKCDIRAFENNSAVGVRGSAA
jgi:hypothetical protein